LIPPDLALVPKDSSELCSDLPKITLLQMLNALSDVNSILYLKGFLQSREEQRKTHNKLHPPRGLAAHTATQRSHAFKNLKAADIFNTTFLQQSSLDAELLVRAVLL